MKQNTKKEIQLGMPLGTATHRLRKMIMFDLILRLGENRCFRCEGFIESCEEMSIDHKEAWLDNDVAMFWSIDNIAFSHLKCNTECKRNSQRIEYPEGKNWCWRCRVFKDESEFPINSRRGRECTSCDSEYRRKHRASKKK